MLEFNQDTRGNIEDIFGEPEPVNNQPGNQGQVNGSNDSWNTQQEDMFSVPENEYAANTQEEIPTHDAKDNDKVRYEYFQSQYDKERQRNDELSRRLAELETVAKMQQQQAPPPPSPAQEEEQFPEFNIPEPKQPYAFNLQEAYTDPTSESAKYLHAKEDYRDKLLQYNAYRTQYVEAKAEEKLRKQEEMFREYQMQMKQEQETNMRVNSVINDVQQKFGASAEEARDFVAKMGDNNIYTIDNMYKFYKSVIAPANNYQQQQQQMYGQSRPSQQFNQYQRSQSLPNNMGVLSQTANNTPDPAKNFMDELLSFNKRRDLKWN